MTPPDEPRGGWLSLAMNAPNVLYERHQPSRAVFAVDVPNGGNVRGAAEEG